MEESEIPRKYPGKKRGPKPEQFLSEEARKEMSERGRKGALSPQRQLSLEKKRISKMKRFIKNYQRYKGLATKASEASKMAYKTYQDWRKQYEWFDQALREIDESVTDFAESKLLELIDGAYEQKIDVKGNIHTVKLAPNVKAVEYYLSAKAKDRGFGKGIDIPNGGIQIVLTPATPKTENNADTIPIEGREEE